MRRALGNVLFVVSALMCWVAAWMLAGDAGAAAWTEHLKLWERRVSGAR